MSTGKQIRVLILLLVLAPLVFAFQYPSNAQPLWNRPQVIAVFPYNPDGSADVERYLQTLRTEDLKPIEQFFNREARRHGLTDQAAFELRLGQPVDHAPALPDPQAGALGRLGWGLSLRWWHWRLDHASTQPDIVVVARFEQGLDAVPQTFHSVGMSNPRLALVSLIAHDHALARNRVTLAHEILHTVGANDFYQGRGGLPSWPEGYAEPQRQPLHPQVRAEIMGGRIPLAPNLAREPQNLREVMIGSATARDIGWLGG